MVFLMNILKRVGISVNKDNFDVYPKRNCDADISRIWLHFCYNLKWLLLVWVYMLFKLSHVFPPICRI